MVLVFLPLLVGEKLDKSLEPRKPLMTGMPNWNKERPKVLLKSVPGDLHDSGQSLIMRFFL
jgi:methanogenic corrinoid protein MtbC1